MLRRFFHRWERSIFDDHADDRRSQEFGLGVDHLAGLVDPQRVSDGSELADMAAEMRRASTDFYRIGAMSGAVFDGLLGGLGDEDAAVRMAAGVALGAMDLSFEQRNMVLTQHRVE